MIAERPQIFYPVNLDLARRNWFHYAWTTRTQPAAGRTEKEQWINTNGERPEMHTSSVKNVQRVLATRAASSWLTHVSLAKVTRKLFREYSKNV